jgi:hypothetical protein
MGEHFSHLRRDGRFPDDLKRWLKYLYEEEGLSIYGISRETGYTTPTIHRVLIEAEASIRTRAEATRLRWQRWQKKQARYQKEEPAPAPAERTRS